MRAFGLGLLVAFGLGITGAAADSFRYAGELPNTEHCNRFKRDILPGVDSQENIRGLNEDFADIKRQGSDGQQCRMIRTRRDRDLNDPIKESTNRYTIHAKERVFLWGRLCGYDMCRSGGGGPQDGDDSSSDRSRERRSETPQQNGTPPPGPRQPDRPSPRRDDDRRKLSRVTICNESEHPVAVALGYRTASDRPLVVKGWFRVERGACRFMGTFARGAFYLFAEQFRPGKRFWPGTPTIRFCVERPQEFEYVNDTQRKCAERDLAGFWDAQLTEPERTITLQ